MNGIWARGWSHACSWAERAAMPGLEVEGVGVAGTRAGAGRGAWLGG